MKLPSMTVGEWIASVILVTACIVGVWLLASGVLSAIRQFVTVGPDDIDAQRSMAISASWMLVIAMLSFVATALGAILVFMTLSENRRSSVAELRAYLQVVPKGVEITDNQVKWQMGVENIGTTPAHRITFTTHAHLLWDFNITDFLKSPQRHATSSVDEAANTLGHGKTWTYPAVTGNWDAAELVLLNELRRDGGTAVLLVWGTLFYVDVFGNRCITNYCHMYSGGKFDAGNAGYTSLFNDTT
ncbi:hypothetical protein [Devosia sp. FKR38]|uniref:hypothetical protein n=1 Tax=Devosia sp. FKR38 TaxID=2562312 RepID=UPI0010BFFCCD|nr:hypothetical protein [Devosia sp. FKR38]